MIAPVLETAKMLRIAAPLFLLAFCAAVEADEIRDALNAATIKFDRDVASIQADVVKYLDEKLLAHQEQGDLDKTLEIQSLKDSFLTEGVLPDVPALRSYRQKVKNRFAQATRDYRIAFVRAIEAYTRGKDLRAAQEVKASLEEFDAAQEEAVIKFPQADNRGKENGEKSTAQNSKDTPEQAPSPPKKAEVKQPGPQVLEPPALQEFIVNRPMVVREDVSGSLRVVAGGNLTLKAVCEGNVIIEPGGVAVITGIVSGNVTNLGGELHFTGIISGQLIRQAGRTVVTPKSIISGVKQ